ncbi:MAG: hypothetical protein H5U19_01505 [Rhodobacteraceae bacterium]|nr:hypothetical protein [Paracoccaceae bacterium]
MVQNTAQSPCERPELSSEPEQVAAARANDPVIRIVVVRGAGGSFCAGGNLNDFQRNYQGADNPEQVAVENRRLGRLPSAARFDGAEALRLGLVRQAVVGAAPLADTFDMAAHRFANALKGDEGREGVSAFHEKRAPSWASAGKAP